MPDQNQVSDRVEQVFLLMKAGDDAFNRQDIDAMNAGRHPDMVAYVTGGDAPTHGRAAHAAVEKAMVRAFPDVHLHVDPYLIHFGEGDWMTMVCKITGTFSGELVLPDGKTIKGTGKSFDLEFSRTAEWQGELLLEEHVFWDSTRLAQQIGIA